MTSLDSESYGLNLPDLRAVYGRVGFLLRRANHIAVSIFLEQSSGLGITNTQYALISILGRRPGLDQAALARLAGLDRSTTGLVSEKLESQGLVSRPAAADRRRRALSLTPRGEAILQTLADAADRAHLQGLAPFTEAEGDQLLALLSRFVSAHNAVARTPLAAE